VDLRLRGAPLILRRRGRFASGEEDRAQGRESLFMESVDGLAGLKSKIATRLATKPDIFIAHPAELRILRSMSDQDLRAFAAGNGWRVIRRLGGRQIQFYNDAGTRLVN